MKSKQDCNLNKQGIDVEITFNSAIIFYNIAHKSLKTYEETGLCTPPVIFASGTNYGLALELFLKSFLSMEGKKIQKTHSLFDLFDKLEPLTKLHLTKSYSNIIEQEEPKELFIRAVTSKNAKLLLENAPKHEIRSKKLEDLLKNNHDMFTMFRYMGERARGDKVESFYFEYSYFNALCKAFIEISSKFGFVELNLEQN